VTFLNQPDTAAPHEGPDFEAATRRLSELIAQDTRCTALLAPWRYDPHCDHEAASLLASAVASAVSIRLLFYPVWGWTLPPDTPVPTPPGAGFRLDISPFLPAKREAIQAHRSQYGDLINDDPTGFRLPTELLSTFDTPFETFLNA